MAGEHLHVQDPFWSSVIELAAEDRFVQAAAEWLAEKGVSDRAVIEDLQMELERHVQTVYGLPPEFSPSVLALAEERI